MNHRSIYSSSESVPQVSEPIEAPRAVDSLHLPEASLTFDEHLEQPMMPRHIDVPDGKSVVFDEGHEGTEEKVKPRVMNPHGRETDIRLLESNLVEEPFVAANVDGKNAHLYYEGKKMLVERLLSEYKLSDGARIEKRTFPLRLTPEVLTNEDRNRGVLAEHYRLHEASVWSE
jgi:hypothetical protein